MSGEQLATPVSFFGMFNFPGVVYLNFANVHAIHHRGQLSAYLRPMGGLVPLFNIQLGEVVFGGVGAGLYGMLMFAVLAVFIAGLMVGRTPEYLGKKIESYEMKMASLVLAESRYGKYSTVARVLRSSE